MTYKEEWKKLLEEHQKNLMSILAKYKDADKRYYEDHINILDGTPPSFKETQLCELKLKNDLKRLKEKYNCEDTKMNK